MLLGTICCGTVRPQCPHAVALCFLRDSQPHSAVSDEEALCFLSVAMFESSHLDPTLNLQPPAFPNSRNAQPIPPLKIASGSKLPVESVRGHTPLGGGESGQGRVGVGDRKPLREKGPKKAGKRRQNGEQSAEQSAEEGAAGRGKTDAGPRMQEVFNSTGIVHV